MLIELSHGLTKLLRIICAPRNSAVPESASQWQCCSESLGTVFPQGQLTPSQRLVRHCGISCQAVLDEISTVWMQPDQGEQHYGRSFILVLFVKLFRWEAEKKSVSKVDIKFKLLLSHFSVFLDHYSYSDDIFLKNHSSTVTKAVFKEQNKPFYLPQTNITKC